MATKKFPLGRVKELAAHVKGLHEHLQSLIADCDATSANDLSDRDAPYAQGQDRKTVKSMDEAFPGFSRDGNMSRLPANIRDRK